MSVSEPIGARIRRLREEREMGLTELAYRVARSEATVSRWETGKLQPRIAQLREVATALGVSIAELVGDEELAA